MSRRVLITAAASGIGRVIAEAFAAQGDTVHLCDVDPAAVAECRTSSPHLHAAQVDLADHAAVEAWLDTAISSLGGVDVLVNNAGTKGPTAFVEDVTIEEWRHCLAVGLDSHYQCAARVAPLMKAQRQGSVINISSTAGLYGYGCRTPYAAAKWAVIGLTKSLAVEFGPHGVRCNAICPGSVRGARIDAVIDAVRDRAALQREVRALASQAQTSAVVPRRAPVTSYASSGNEARWPAPLSTTTE